MNHFLQIQEELTKYFDEYDNETLVAFIESFSFHLPAKKEGIGKLIEKFLKDNDIESAYVNYVSDYVDNESKIFARTSGSDRTLIDQMKMALNIIVFNRFRKMDFSKPIIPEKVKFLGSADIEFGTICIKDNLRDEYTLCGTLIEGDYSGESKETDEEANCKHCLRVVNYCKKIQL